MKVTIQLGPGGTYNYIWFVKNIMKNNGISMSGIDFQIDDATVLATKTGCEKCLSATWNVDPQNRDRSFTSLRFDRPTKQMAGSIPERFFYTLDRFVSPLNIGVATSNGKDLVILPDPTVPGCEVLVDGPLPVELTTLDARTDGDAVLLTWETASETNNAGFEIQHDDGTTGFVTRGYVEGAGTTLEARRYAQRLTGLEPGVHTFRLKQVDYDGAFVFSPVVEVTIEVADRYYLSSAYPNPFNPRTQFSVAVQKTQAVEVSIHDMLGRRVALLHRGLLEAGTTHPFAFDAGTLPSGLYLVRIKGTSFSETQTITLLK